MRAAALDLLAQELEILGDRAVLRQDVVELLGDERDGGERRAELVRRGGGEAVELRAGAARAASTSSVAASAWASWRASSATRQA